LLQHAIERAFQTKTKPFTSPLNCFIKPYITNCSALMEDSDFGALHNAFGYIWTGSCAANPEYDLENKKKTILDALASSTDTPTPFLAILILPLW
jgi:hypothetical protein